MSEGEIEGKGEHEVFVQVTGGEDDIAADVQALARALRLELLRLDVEGVDLVTEQSLPEGAKGLALVSGALQVRAVARELRAIIAGLRGWIARNNRSVTITLDGDTLTLSAASSKDQERLIDLFVSKHAA